MSNKKTNEKALEYAKTSLAFEGMYLTSDEEALILKRAKGEISHKEFLEEAVKLAESQ